MKLKLFILLFIISACSSAPKREAPAAQHSNNSYDLVDMGDDDLPAPKQVPANVTDSNVNYDSLRQAVISGDQKKVNEISSQLLARNPKDVQALNALGIQQLKNGKFPMARLIFKKALDIDAKNAGILNNYGLTFLGEKEEDRAFAEFKKALDVNPRNAAAAANIGAIHLKYKNFGEAKTWLETAFEANRTNTKVASNFALALRGSGDAPGARRVLEQALDKDPKDATLLVNYASVLIESLGDKTKGQEVINKIRFLNADAAIMERVRELEAKAK